MASLTNRQILLNARPVGFPVDTDFRMAATPVPEPGDGQLLIRTIYLSLDPYMRGRMSAGLSYAPGVQLGDVMVGGTVGQVVASRHAGFAEGDFVLSASGWQEYAVSDGGGVRTLDPAVAPISTALGVLGMPGLTAYVGLLDVGELKPGDHVVVSAASGAVGAVAGQIARLRGCRVVGIAGARKKCDYVTGELGLDACVSHHSATLAEDLQAACPDGVDLYFENVGGKVFEAVLPLLNERARISLCGVISDYGNDDFEETFADWMAQGEATFTRQSVEAQRLSVGAFVPEYQEQFLAEMGAWLSEGRVQYKEDLWPGLEQAPEAFRAMMAGRNFGKTLVGVGDDPTLDADDGAVRSARTAR